VKYLIELIKAKILEIFVYTISPIIVGCAIYYVMVHGPFYAKAIVGSTLSFMLYVAYYNRYHNPISISRRLREAKEEELRKKKEREESIKRNSLRQREPLVVTAAKPQFDPELISNFPGYTSGQRILAFIKYHLIEWAERALDRALDRSVPLRVRLHPYTALFLKFVVIPAGSEFAKTEPWWGPVISFVVASYANPDYFRESVYYFCFDSWQ
jgi:hypothetical protein